MSALIQRRMSIRPIALVLAALIATAATAQPYHLELEATPEAVFPYLGRFGNVELHVYAGGVRAEALWLNAFSRNDAEAVTVTNPLARMYVDVDVDEISAVLTKLAGAAGNIERNAAPVLSKPVAGKVKGIAAKRTAVTWAMVLRTAVPTNWP